MATEKKRDARWWAGYIQSCTEADKNFHKPSTGEWSPPPVTAADVAKRKQQAKKKIGA